MFSKIIDTLRSHSSNRHHNIPDINVDRRSSDDQDACNNNNSSISPLSDTSPRTDISGNSTSAIGIKPIDNETSLSASDSIYNKEGRRRSSLFGYSTNAADDYMQKDLLSSSWS